MGNMYEIAIACVYEYQLFLIKKHFVQLFWLFNAILFCLSPNVTDKLSSLHQCSDFFAQRLSRSHRSGRSLRGIGKHTCLKNVEKH